MTKKILSAVLITFISAFIYANEIKLSQKTYYTTDKTLSADDLAQDLFTADKYVNTGSYEQICWIETEIPTDSFGIDRIVLCFNNELFYKAQVFVLKSGGQWYEAGKTGSGIRLYEKSVPTWKQAVLLPLPESDSQALRLRIRISTNQTSAISLTAMTVADFAVKNAFQTFVISLIIGTFFITAAFIFYNGIFFKDRTSLFQSAILLFLFLHILSATGIGATYLWNKIAVTMPAYRCNYVFLIGAILCCVNAVTHFNRQYIENFPEADKKLFPLYIVYTWVTAIITLVNFLIPSNLIIKCILLCMMIISLIILAYQYNLSMIHTPAQTKAGYAAYMTAFSLIFIQQLFHLLRFTRRNISLFRIFDNDIDWPVIAAFILIAFTTLKHLFVKIRSKIAQLEINTAETQEQVKIENRRSYIYSQLAAELLNPLHVISAALNSSPPDETSEIRSVIKSNVSSSIEILTALYVLSCYESKPANIDMNTEPLNLQEFVSDCIKYELDDLKLEGCYPDIRENFTIDVCVLADRNLLAVFFKFILQAVKKCVKPNTSIFISIDYHNYILAYSIHFYSDPIPTADSKEIFDLKHMDSPEDSPERNNFDSIMQKWGPQLHVVKKIIELYRGSINIIPDKDSNTICAQIALEPTSVMKLADCMQTKQQKIPPAAYSPDSAPAYPETIYILEEDQESRNALIKILKPFYKTAAFNNGNDALNSIKANKPDLIIASITLPGIRSIELLEYCRENEKLRYIPFSFLTKFASRRTVRGLYEKGAISVIEKPFSPELFLLKINSFLHNRKMMAENMISSISDTLRSAVFLQKSDINEKNTGEDVFNMLKKQPAANTGSTVTDPSLTAFFTSANLTDREMIIAKYIAEGRADKEIAGLLNISPATVAVHNKKIFKKLNIHSRNELISKVK